ncbi:MAG: hypothetical protein ACPLPS_10680 [bacterium]
MGKIYMSKPKVLQICHMGSTLKLFVRPLKDALLQEGWIVESTASFDEDTRSLVRLGYKVHYIPYTRPKSSA